MYYFVYVAYNDAKQAEKGKKWPGLNEYMPIIICSLGLNEDFLNNKELKN